MSRDKARERMTALKEHGLLVEGKGRSKPLVLTEKGRVFLEDPVPLHTIPDQFDDDKQPS